MATIRAEFSHWEGDRAYINYYVDGFKLGAHYYTCAVIWKPDPYGVYYRHCGVIATWGWTYDVRYKSKRGYVRGYKIDDGDITITLAVVVDVILKNFGVCWEGDYHPEWVDASTNVYIPKKTVPCTQSFKVINKLTKEPESGAPITIFELPYPECITGYDGRCSIPNLQKGKTYEIAVNKEGYYTGGGAFKVCDGEIVFEIEEPCYVEGKTRCVGNDLYQCMDHRWRLVEANSPTCVPPECVEGAHEVLEYCPDGVTEKRWQDCIGGKWVEDSQACPEPAKGIFVGTITIDTEEVARDGTIKKRPTDKELICQIKNTGGIAQKLALSLVYEPGEVIWSGETDRAIGVGEEVLATLPPFSYPGGSKNYKIVVEP